MTKPFILTAFLALSLFFLPGFTTSTQDPAEREAQKNLPQSEDKIWDLFSQTEVKFDSETGLYTASIPDSINDKKGQALTVSGFIMPLEAEEKFTHFLLSKRTPTCAYCPPGEPNEIIEVFSADPVEWDEGLVTFEGTFELTNNQEFGLFYQLKAAKKK